MGRLDRWLTMRVSVAAGGPFSQEHPSSTILVPLIDIPSDGRIYSNERLDGFVSESCIPAPSGFIPYYRRVLLSLPRIIHRVLMHRNTGFPCLLRFVIWILFKVFPNGSPTKETLAFLLDHPRRCFTLLFPSSATWWLFGVLVLLNVLDLFFFLVLDLGDNYVSQIPFGYRFLDGFFQVHPSPSPGLPSRTVDRKEFRRDINCRR